MGPKLIIALSTFLVVYGKQCRDAAIPDSKPRGVNQVSSNSTKPLFELELIPRDQAGAFEVRIKPGIQAYAFRDVTVAMTTNGTCGKGSLHYDSHDFTQVLQDESCPTVLSTKRSTSMTSLPSLLWTPPSCGCVQFRVVLALAAENYYYIEAEGVSMGPLAKHVCVQEKLKELSRGQRLDALCHVSEKYTSRSILSRLTFRKRHQLDSQYTDRLELEMALELRRSDARMCCSKVSQTEKLKCFDNARYRRTDRFCQDGFPDIPFVTFRTIFMRGKERRCCSILGTYRYLCFAKDSQLETGSDVTPMDYSLDATDLANDLADFATLEDYQEMLDKMFNISTSKHDVLRSMNNSQYDNIKGEDNKYAEKQSESGREDDIKTVDAEKVTKDEAMHPKATENKSPERDAESSYVSKTSTDASKTPKPTPSTSSAVVQRAQARKDGGLFRSSSEKNTQNTEIYRRFPTYSKPRRLPETSAERRKYRLGSGGKSGARRSFHRSSSERKARDRKLYSGRGTYPRSSERKTGSTKNTGRGSRRFTSFERRYRGFTNSGQSREVLGGRMDVMEDIDNDGGSTVEDTLNHLDRKMKRLELRRLCCEAGAYSGSGVYGSLSIVITECKHSSHKYLQREEIPFGIRKCRKQFVRCCMDEAKMGPTMSNTEFRNKARDEFSDNDGMTEAVDQDDVFLSRGLFRKREKATPRQFRTLRQDANVQDILDAESDRRFESMRAEAGDPRFVGEEGDDEEEEDEEKTGIMRFDDEDNRNSDAEIPFDDVTNKRTLTDKRMSATASQIKDPPTTPNPFEVIDTDVKQEQEEEYEKDDYDKQGEMGQIKEDFDNTKRSMVEDKRPKVARRKEDETIQVKKGSHPDRQFTNSEKVPTNNETDGQMIPQSKSRTVNQRKGQFQTKAKESNRQNTTHNASDNTQNLGKSNKSIEPGTSELTPQEVLQPSNQTKNKNVDASRVDTDESYLKNIDKSNSSDSKDELGVSEMMHRKANPPPTQSRNRPAVGSRLSSVPDDLPKTDIRSRLDVNNDRESSFNRQQQAIAPTRQYHSRSRERSRITSGTADDFRETVPKSNSNRSRKPWRKEGGSSRRRFRHRHSNRRRQRKHRSGEREKRVKDYAGNHQNQATMDSREMAEAHDERVKLTALDSKEMAARYDQGSEPRATFRYRENLNSRTGGSSKRRRRHRNRIGQ